MDRQQFISYIKEPALLDKASLQGIESLSEQFPYCQSLQILHLLNLKIIDHVMYSEQLKSTAAHIADRKRLRELIRSLQTEEPELVEAVKAVESAEPVDPIEGVEEEVAAEPVKPARATESVVPVVEEDEEERLKRLKQIVENRLKQIALEKDEIPKPEDPVLTKEELIEKFIKKEPSISRPKPDFFDPVKVARSSREDQPGLVTETLARVHIQQGNIDKAIEIYRKLSLNFPEKSAYFAAQIEKLSTEN
ncbi:MAG: hypothetical protein DRJ15_00175 [Bacteroidetes bacterium]|nr:MAG: hypothetical protein DRI83_02355 [Bacteroidota bacterium]RLD82889.1 MAG: hypothetical protein DRJ15_00175 [Bacteroidota bacterium]